VNLGEDWRAYGAELERARAGIDVEALGTLLSWIDEVRRHGGHLLVLGNGGSAAAAAHWACDFGKGATVPGQRRLKVLAPNEQVPWHTALANDVSYEDALAEQVASWVGRDDLALALSVSGDSENLVRACVAARRGGARTAAIVGAAGGRLAAAADLAVVIPSRDYGVVEDLHLTINHVLSQHLRRAVAAGAALPAPGPARPGGAAGSAHPHWAIPALTGGEWEAILATLSPAEQGVVRDRFGLDDGERRTQGEVASRHGLSVAEVRRIEAKLFRLLEEAL
jgi:D-sedoheptulose 7-phosphate isomerase